METNPYQSPSPVQDTAPRRQDDEREHPLVEATIKVSYGVLLVSVVVMLWLLTVSILSPA